MNGLGAENNHRGEWLHINQIMRDERIGVLAIEETHLTENTLGILNDLFQTRLSIINSAMPAENPPRPASLSSSTETSPMSKMSPRQR